MKKSNIVKVKLNKNKLFEIINAKGTTPQELSTQLGYNRDYICNLFAPSKDSALGLPNTLAICSLLGIDVEEIKDNTPETLKEEENVTVNLETINSSLLAINETLKELVMVYRKAWIDEH